MDKQILIMDGAMGSLIQEYKLTEEQFRGNCYYYYYYYVFPQQFLF